MSLVRDRHRAEDLCQETYLRFFRMQRPIDQSRPLLPLLLSILRNLVVSESRRPSTASLDDREGGNPHLADDAGETPLKEAIRREETASVEAALERLSPDWRSVLYLRDGLGFSYGEIAETLGRSADSVRVTLHRARRRVRELLQGKDLDERRVQ
jgi:RNA polymerase sigma-70 factor (ECF subfamily)